MQSHTMVEMSQRWEEKRDPQTGNTYWVDHVNQCSTWTNPFAPNQQPVNNSYQQGAPAPQAQYQTQPNMYTQGAAGAFSPSQQIYNQPNHQAPPPQVQYQAPPPQVQHQAQPSMYTQGAAGAFGTTHQQYNQGAPPGGFTRMPQPGLSMIEHAMDQATANAPKTMFGFRSEQNEYAARVAEARNMYSNNPSPQTMLTVKQYADIVVRPTLGSHNFEWSWQAIYKMQRNGVAVILPKVAHKYDNGDENSSGGIHLSDYTTLDKGFQLELTCVENMDWMTLATPLLQGTGVNHSDIARMVGGLNQIASKNYMDCCSCCLLLFSIPCCCLPYCQYRDNKNRERHAMISRRVVEFNAQTLHPHGIQLNYHVQPCDFPQSYHGAMYYLSLTSTLPIFPQQCFDAIPGNRQWFCCNVPDQIPAKIFEP